MNIKWKMSQDNKVKTPEVQQNFVKRWPVFYGWIIMIAGTFGFIMTSPGQTQTVSIFIELIIQDLHLSRSMVSSLYSIGTLVGSFTLIYWGRQIDRRGSRKMVVIISVLFGLACIFMGLAKNVFMLGLGFIMIRMLGMGSLTLVSQTMINQWWIRKRGMIMGISGMLLALFGMGVFPSIVYALIQALDWRVTYAILGLSQIILMAPIGYLFYRNRPEDYQLYPDGVETVKPEEIHSRNNTEPIEENWTLKEALKTRAFWILGIGISIFSLINTGLLFHLVSIFKIHSLDASLAASVFVPIALASGVFTLTGGYLTDRIPIRYLLALGLLFQAASLIMAEVIRGTITAYLFGVVLGATIGIARALGSVSWPALFGRKHLGSIYGFASAMSVVGAALGPLPFGFSYDAFGNYRGVLIASALICLLLSFVGLSVRKPHRKIDYT